MAPSPQCAALAGAMNNKGMSYSQVANKIGQSEQHVIDICTGAAVPTEGEFNALASALGITSPVPANSAHATKK